MAAKFFGQFLLEKGLINREQLLHALDVQRASNPMLGELAVASGMLSDEQAERVNQRQRAEDKRFGDLAIDLGLLDSGQVETLLSMQKARRRFFGEILVDAGIMQSQQVEDELRLHRLERDQAVRALELGVEAHALGPMLTEAINACTKLFPRLFKAPSQYSQLVERSAQLDAFPVAGAVHISGAREFSLVVACDFDTMTRVAGAFLGLHAIACDEDLARDALGEFLNVVMGYVAKECLPEDAVYRASPPDFTHVAASFVRGGDASLGAVMTSELGDFALIVSA